MGIESWSTTPASNNAAPPAGAPEGMAPSAVNNVTRQQMADHRAQWNDAEWFDYGDGEGSATVTYVAADQFKVEGVDVSTAYHVGRRVRVVGSGTGTIYGTINAVAFSIDTTVTVTLDTGSMSNETLTVSLGIMSAQNEAMKLDAQRLVKGVIEANANFVDFVVFGPALDPVKDWHKRLGSSVATALMLATVEDTGADTEVNVWDLTDPGLISGTPLATVTITGAATPTSIDAAMGYIIIGSEDGVSIIEPHDGAWAERTEGWPKSLSTSTTPALQSNSVNDVAAGMSDQPHFDPRTNGPMPTFGIAFAANATSNAAVMMDSGEFLQSNLGSSSSYGADHAEIRNGRLIINNVGSAVRIYVSDKFAGLVTSGFNQAAFDDTSGGNIFAVQSAKVSSGPGGALARATTSGIDLVSDVTAGASSAGLVANINRTYNTGNMPLDIRGAWLANSKTADRSYKANTLTENGTVTEAAVESGAELNGYSGFSASNYLERAYDADFDMAQGLFAIFGWFKTNTNSTTEVFLHRADDPPSSGAAIQCGIEADGDIYASVDDGTNTSTAVLASTPFDDNAWHFFCMDYDGNTGTVSVYVDGQFLDSTTNGSMGTLTDVSNILALGAQTNGGTPCTNTTLALWRWTVTVPSPAQIRHVYETERRMFEANAKCLLQSGTTDAVLDVSIDPITGKVGVVQTDDEVLFDGLVIDEEPALPSGAANWEHVARYGGDRLVLTNANLYADIAAKDIREELEELRGERLPKGPNLGRVKAWASINGDASPTVLAGYNIKSVERTSIGRYVVNFEVPFKSSGYAINVTVSEASSANTSRTTANIRTLDPRFAEVMIKTGNDDGGGTYALADIDFTLIAVGELENE